MPIYIGNTLVFGKKKLREFGRLNERLQGCLEG